MKRRNFLAALAALPFLANPLRALSLPQCWNCGKRKLDAGTRLGLQCDECQEDDYACARAFFAKHQVPVGVRYDGVRGVVTEVNRRDGTITVDWSRL